ncbi:hypothetical protein DL96DRAFT_478726 [Flagelloscypha sp. PMI_526]|nr:hypothetical protein DL96DRAFT_478726 [Flagelloscypha sp. PMI_526]
MTKKHKMFKFTLFTLAGSFFTTLVLAGLIPSHLRQAGNCADVTTIFARGTTKIPDIGTVVGPYLSPIKKAMTLDFQGVDYPANVAGFLQVKPLDPNHHHWLLQPLI